MTGERVCIERHKYPDVPHYEYDTVHLGDDEHGAWFWAPTGNDVRRAGELVFHTTEPSLFLVPVDRPWMVWFGNHLRHGFDIYVDVGTLPIRTPGRVTMVDLDLDVIRRTDGTVEVLDEDELELHSVQYAYPPALVAHAREVADDVVRLLAGGVEPFGETWKRWEREGAGP